PPFTHYSHQGHCKQHNCAPRRCSKPVKLTHKTPTMAFPRRALIAAPSSIQTRI
ncbi:hypothetical protein PIB30_056758, partial [Stylosanthes scabra]|nr:hypothetical protein [Stylosanthes scabra]